MYSKLPDYNLNMQPWKPALSKVPHLTIETNMTCNFRCRNCYNIDRNKIKSLNEILQEIDAGLQKRKADSITLIGGEPTLHPDLEKIIRYIKTKKVICQMLTNGFILAGPGGEKFIDTLIEAGLDRILLHIDEGQDAYPDTYGTLHSVLKKLESRKLFVSISWTIYKGRQGNLPGLVTEFSTYRNFDGILTILEKNVDNAIREDYNGYGMPDMQTEFRSLNESLGLYPSLYLPSSMDNDRITWFIYLYYINSGSGKTFHVSPWLAKVYMNAYLFFTGRELFGKTTMRSSFKLSLYVTGMLECIAKPRRIKEFVTLVKTSRQLHDLRFHYLTIQDGPEFDKAWDQVSVCYHCPDATIRNGKLTPVCLADRINPFSSGESAPVSDLGVAETVFSHLHET